MRLIDKVDAFWSNDHISFKQAGCTNPFDNIVVVLAGLAYGFGKLILYIFLRDEILLLLRK